MRKEEKEWLASCDQTGPRRRLNLERREATEKRMRKQSRKEGHAIPKDMMVRESAINTTGNRR